MTRRILTSLLVIAALTAAILYSRREPIYMNHLAGQTPASDLTTREELISGAIEILTPEAGRAPYPTVIMLHGCAGPRMSFQRQWAEQFNKAGFAAMIVDSTGPRGYDRQSALDIVCNGEDLIGHERAGDIYAAINIAQSDVRLDTGNIVLAGWSHGAWTAMDFLTMNGADKRPAGLSGELPSDFSVIGSVLFYPYCGQGSLSRFRNWIEDTPTTVLIAGEDTIVNSEECIALFERKKWESDNVEMIVYPGAEHVFDDPFLEPDYIHWYDEKFHKDAESRINRFVTSLQLTR